MIAKLMSNAVLGIQDSQVVTCEKLYFCKFGLSNELSEYFPPVVRISLYANRAVYLRKLNDIHPIIGLRQKRQQKLRWTIWLESNKSQDSTYTSIVAVEWRNKPVQRSKSIYLYVRLIQKNVGILFVCSSSPHPIRRFCSVYVTHFVAPSSRQLYGYPQNFVIRQAQLLMTVVVVCVSSHHTNEKKTISPH